MAFTGFNQFEGIDESILVGMLGNNSKQIALLLGKIKYPPFFNGPATYFIHTAHGLNTSVGVLESAKFSSPFSLDFA
jgi:hypothetical protein